MPKQFWLRLGLFCLLLFLPLQGMTCIKMTQKQPKQVPSKSCCTMYKDNKKAKGHSIISTVVMDMWLKLCKQLFNPYKKKLQPLHRKKAFITPSCWAVWVQHCLANVVDGFALAINCSLQGSTTDCCSPKDMQNTWQSKDGHTVRRLQQLICSMFKMLKVWKSLQQHICIFFQKGKKAKRSFLDHNPTAIL